MRNRKLATVRSLPTTETPSPRHRRAHPATPMTQGALALRYQDAPQLPAPPVLRLVPTGPSLPDAQAWATRLVQAVAEVLAGDRPIGQLIRFTDTVVFTDLNRRVRVLGLTTTATGPQRRENAAPSVRSTSRRPQPRSPRSAPTSGTATAPARWPSAWKSTETAGSAPPSNSAEHRVVRSGATRSCIRCHEVVVRPGLAWRDHQRIDPIRSGGTNAEHHYPHPTHPKTVAGG